MHVLYFIARYYAYKMLKIISVATQTLLKPSVQATLILVQ